MDRTPHRHHRFVVRRPARPARHRRRSALGPPEWLEGRTLLSTFIPTIFTDSNLSGSGSLREAVIEANLDTGADPDSIELQSGTYTLTISSPAGHDTSGLT